MYTPRQSIAVSTKSCPYDGIPFLSALRKAQTSLRALSRRNARQAGIVFGAILLGCSHAH